MRWERVDSGEWRIAENGFSGRALLRETNSGFIASINVSEDQFDMELLDDRDFFESRDDALTFLEERMDRSSY